MRVYFDNAATTPLDPDVMDAMTATMLNDFGNPSSVHSYGRKARTLIEEARKTVAEILNASIGEIFFTSSATESNNMSIIGAVRDLGVLRIISSPSEHPCVLKTINFVREHYGITVKFLHVDALGNPDLNQLSDVLSSEKIKSLVSLMHGNNEIGTMMDIKKCAEICTEHDALFHSDTVQTIGKFEIDLNQTRINFLSATGHKIFGPKGTGIVYINHGNPIKPLITGGGQERNMRSGTENTYGIVGFAKALEKIVLNRKSYTAHMSGLREHMKKRLTDTIPDIRFNGNQDGLFLPHILSVNLKRTPRSELAVFNLDINNICASAGSACASGAEQDSHVLEAINSPKDRKTIRFSFSHLNTIDEVEYVVDKMKEALVL